jgi:hypothetical protein
MAAFVHSLRRVVRRGESSARPAVAPGVREREGDAEATAIEIAPNDAIIAYFQSAAGAVDIDALELDSPALRELQAAGVKLVVPLIAQGE